MSAGFLHKRFYFGIFSMDQFRHIKIHTYSLFQAFRSWRLGKEMLTEKKKTARGWGRWWEQRKFPPLSLFPHLSLPYFFFPDLLLLRRTVLSVCLEQANSYFAERLRGIKQKKSSWGSRIEWYISFLFPLKPWSQVIYRNWSLPSHCYVVHPFDDNDPRNLLARESSYRFCWGC